MPTAHTSFFSLFSFFFASSRQLRLCLAAAAAGTLLVLTMSATSHAAEARPPVAIVHTAPRGPIGRDFADPFVLRDGGVYYAYATGAGGRNVQAARSRDLVSWVTLPDALPRLPAWASKEKGLTWAPTVLRRKDGYVLYYTTRDASSGFQCISRATSTRPQGPYADDSKEPFVCQVRADTPFCGSIDPSPVVDGDGRAYLLWKSDENSASCGKDPRIWAQPLSDDGLTLTGSPVALLAMDRSWESPIVEGPSMVSYGGLYFLFYSANRYESAKYAIGYATCVGPLGPCKKVTTAAPLVGSHGAALGPGGQEFFTDARGLTWMAYHAWRAPRTRYAEGGARVLRLARVTFTATGAPVVNTSVPPRDDARRRPGVTKRASPRTS